MNYNPRDRIDLVEVTKLFRQAMVSSGDNLDIAALAKMQEHIEVLDKVCAAELAGERAFKNVIGNSTRTNSLMMELACKQKQIAIYETMNPGHNYEEDTKLYNGSNTF